MNENKRRQWIRIGTIFGVLVLLIGIAYAWITLTIQGQKEHVLKVGSLELVLNESSEAINIEKAIPISDSEGQALTGFTFTLENTGVLDSDYTIYLDDTELQEGETRLADSNIKFSLEKNGTVGTPTILSEIGENPNRILDTGSLKRQEKNTYILRIWLADTSSGDIAGQVMRVKLRVEAIQKQGEPAVEKLLAKVNNESLDYNSATSEQQKEMWTFSHTAGAQQAGWTSEELTDYRYIESNPNNYAEFNEELWRIIGIFTVETPHLDATYSKVQTIKLIKDTASDDTAWNSDGTDNWVGSSLQNNLNTNYLVSLNKTAQSMILEAKWYLGGPSEFTTASNGLTTHWYNYERGTEVYDGNSTSWIGKIGLMYPSDYGFATSGNNNTSRNRCIGEYALYTWNSYADCRDNDWLHQQKYVWTITPRASGDKYVASLTNEGYIMTGFVGEPKDIRPVVYLNSDIQITSGDGSSSNPYQLSQS